MRINNAYPYQTPARRTGTTSGASGRTSFGQQLDIAASRSADKVEVSISGAVWQNAEEMKSSPYMKLLDSYQEWKAQQPPQERPDSWGPTEENLAYLKEHYTGDLSWEERVDALETMVQMGVITREQEGDARGGAVVCGTWEEIKPILEKQAERVMKEYYAYQSGGWDACFQDWEMSKFKTADDLFAWLDKILESES